MQCNHDCFNCPFPDCIDDSYTPEDAEEIKKIETKYINGRRTNPPKKESKRKKELADYDKKYRAEKPYKAEQECIRKRRISAEMYLREAAAGMGISVTTLNNWERGVKKARWDIVEKLWPDIRGGQQKMDNRYYIVRSTNAGVFAGNIKERTGDEVTMTDVRRLWYWDGAASLSQLAVEGVTRPGNCKFTVTVPEMTILGVCEIIPCTDMARECIKAVAEWKR